MTIIRMAAFHAKMAQQSICRHAGGANELAHLYQHRQYVVPGIPPPPGMPPVTFDDSDGNDSYQMHGIPPRCVYIHSLLPNTQFFNYNAYAKDSKHDNDFIPDLLSTLSAVWKYRWQWFWRQEQHFEQIWQWRRGLIEQNGMFQYIHYL